MDLSDKGNCTFPSIPYTDQTEHFFLMFPFSKCRFIATGLVYTKGSKNKSINFFLKGNFSEAVATEKVTSTGNRLANTLDLAGTTV